MTRIEQPTAAGRSHDWGRPRSKTVTWRDPAIIAAAGPSMSGIDFLRAIRDGDLPPPPMAALFGMRMRDIELGRVAFARAEITDGTGRLVATATGTCLIIDGREG
jgi:hypothetical protein